MIAHLFKDSTRLIACIRNSVHLAPAAFSVAAERLSLGYRVFRNAMSADLSAADSFNPNSCPLTARFSTA